MSNYIDKNVPQIREKCQQSGSQRQLLFPTLLVAMISYPHDSIALTFSRKKASCIDIETTNKKHGRLTKDITSDETKE